MIESGKYYRTRGTSLLDIEPQPVTILSTTAMGEFPVVGVIHKKGSDLRSQWTADGFALYWKGSDYRDLLEVTKEQWNALYERITVLLPPT